MHEGLLKYQLTFVLLPLKSIQLLQSFQIGFIYTILEELAQQKVFRCYRNLFYLNGLPIINYQLFHYQLITAPASPLSPNIY